MMSMSISVVLEQVRVETRSESLSVLLAPAIPKLKTFLGSTDLLDNLRSSGNEDLFPLVGLLVTNPTGIGSGSRSDRDLVELLAELGLLSGNLTNVHDVSFLVDQQSSWFS